MDPNKEYVINKYIFAFILFCFGLILVFSLMQFFTAFLGATIFYVLSRPALVWMLDKKKWNKNLAAILVILVTFFIILLPISLLVILLFNKVSTVVSNPNDIIHTFKNFDAIIFEKTSIHIIADNTISKAQEMISEVLKAVFNQGLGIVSSLIMMYFFLFFMIKNTNRMEASIVYYLPFKGEKIKRFGEELVAQTFSNAIGIPTIAVLQGLLGFACYKIVGINEPGFWGVITGFTSVIPVVGCGIVWLPMAFFQIVDGNYGMGIFILLWGALIMGLMDNVIRFVLAKKMADVHPIITVLGIIMGLKYFGIVGLIFGPLLISYFLLLLQIYYLEFQKPVAPVKNKPRQLVPSFMQPLLGIKKSSKPRKNENS
ncbi:MAG: AI-2E family transporter [Bacteroidetes bacterium]|nr:AI-2E family transporter [Bacteroidota bacterium]